MINKSIKLCQLRFDRSGRLACHLSAKLHQASASDPDKAVPASLISKEDIRQQREAFVKSFEQDHVSLSAVLRGRVELLRGFCDRSFELLDLFPEGEADNSNNKPLPVPPVVALIRPVAAPAVPLIAATVVSLIAAPVDPSVAAPVVALVRPVAEPVISSVTAPVVALVRPVAAPVVTLVAAPIVPPSDNQVNFFDFESDLAESLDNLQPDATSPTVVSETESATPRPPFEELVPHLDLFTPPAMRSGQSNRDERPGRHGERHRHDDCSKPSSNSKDRRRSYETGSTEVTGHTPCSEAGPSGSTSTFFSLLKPPTLEAPPAGKHRRLPMGTT